MSRPMNSTPRVNRTPGFKATDPDGLWMVIGCLSFATGVTSFPRLVFWQQRAHHARWADLVQTVCYGSQTERLDNHLASVGAPIVAAGALFFSRSIVTAAVTPVKKLRRLPSTDVRFPARNCLTPHTLSATSRMNAPSARRSRNAVLRSSYEGLRTSGEDRFIEPRTQSVADRMGGASSSPPAHGEVLVP